MARRIIGCYYKNIFYDYLIKPHAYFKKSYLSKIYNRDKTVKEDTVEQWFSKKDIDNYFYYVSP